MKKELVCNSLSDCPLEGCVRASALLAGCTIDEEKFCYERQENVHESTLGSNSIKTIDLEPEAFCFKVREILEKQLEYVSNPQSLEGQEIMQRWTKVMFYLNSRGKFTIPQPDEVIGEVISLIESLSSLEKGRLHFYGEVPGCKYSPRKDHCVEMNFSLG